MLIEELLKYLKKSYSNDAECLHALFMDELAGDDVDSESYRGRMRGNSLITSFLKRNDTVSFEEITSFLDKKEIELLEEKESEYCDGRKLEYWDGIFQFLDEFREELEYWHDMEEEE